MRNRISFRNERGQSVTEFALVLPVLLLILFGVVQFGIVFNDYITLTDAVRAGARKGAVSRLSGDPCGEAIAQLRRSGADLDGDLQPSCNTLGTRASDITVSATYPYEINIIGLVVASGRMSSTIVERLE